MNHPLATAMVAWLVLSPVQPLAAQAAHSVGVLQVNPPPGHWRVARQTDFGIVFSKDGPSGLTDMIAYANVYEASGPLDEDGLMREAKANVASFFHAPNAKVGSTTFEKSKDRAYPCVSVSSAMKVFQGSEFTGESVSKQMRVLICQPRGRTKYGFVLGFTYSANTALTEKDALAAQFFGGVQLAGPK
jgi:hypothetical protein